MRLATFFLLAGGLALFIGLIVAQGIGGVTRATAAAGWGVLAVVAFHLVPVPTRDPLQMQCNLHPGRRRIRACPKKS